MTLMVVATVVMIVVMVMAMVILVRGRRDRRSMHGVMVVQHVVE